ncbi:MAG: glycerol-3-phosphate 1-O-acyltransferase PlsY [Firmicutes bacterium]|nr:glycerol-3-phosphate 1-O-acyltransferase PlsY [Bacillota bacterium]
MDAVWKIVLAVIIAYALGNISPSIIQGKLHGIDIKKEGSGNAGTTNTLRVLGKKAAVITLVIDVLKGVAAVLIGNALAGEQAGYLCALAVFCGHIWPCIYGFKGGKGVATAFGALLAVNWALGLSALAIVALGVIVTMKMSVGSILGAATFPLVCWFIEPGFIAIGTVMAVIILVKHRANIGRLMRGEEPKMSFKKK